MNYRTALRYGVYAAEMLLKRAADKPVAELAVMSVRECIHNPSESNRSCAATCSADALQTDPHIALLAHMAAYGTFNNMWIVTEAVYTQLGLSAFIKVVKNAEIIYLEEKMKKIKSTIGELFNSNKDEKPRNNHPNSRESLAKLDGLSRRQLVFSVYKKSNSPLSDRQVMKYLGQEDPNYVRPRATELLEMGLLKEVGNVLDDDTGRTVRLMTVNEKTS